MNIILLCETDRGEDDRTFVLTDHRARHVHETLGKTEGEPLRVGRIDGPLGTAIVRSSTADRLVIEATFDDDIPPRPTIDLIIAVPRPKSLRRILREASALGVRRIVFMRTWKVDKAYLGSPLLEPDGYRPLLLEGLMQARDTHLPEVVIEPRFKPFVEDRAPTYTQDQRGIVLHPGATARLTPNGTDGPAAVVIGPEGGFTDYEVAAFEAAGFERHTLGPRVLRVETACIAALAILHAEPTIAR